MNATKYSAQLQEEMTRILISFVEPGYTDFTTYREAVARYQALAGAKDQLRTTIDEEDDQGR